jgi:hypothetical protein
MSRADPNDAARDCGLTAPFGVGSVEWLGVSGFIRVGFVTAQ